MALAQKSAAWKANYVPPPVDGDFYKIADILNPAEKETLRRVRAFIETEVAPIIEDCWAKAKFPFEIIPKLPALGIARVGYEGYGCAGGSTLLNGFICMEMACIDASYLCGSFSLPPRCGRVAQS